MKKPIGLLTVIIIIYFIATMTMSKFMSEATQETNSEEMYQTWKEFLESGVKIEYAEIPSVINDTNN